MLLLFGNKKNEIINEVKMKNRQFFSEMCIVIDGAINR